jgi:glucose/arabinose dehydrogenase
VTAEQSCVEVAMRNVARALLVAVPALCRTPAAAEITNAPAAPKSQIKVETVAKGLVHPWALQFLPDGRMLATERPGRMRLIGKDGRLSSPLQGVPEVVAQNQGGLLDAALSPDFAQNGLIYFTFSEPRGGWRNGTSLARAKLTPGGDGGRLDDVTIIFRQEPAASGGLHFGSRLAFAADGTIFLTLGERFQRDYAQDLSRHWGKVIRINPDGSTPRDNPFIGRNQAQPEIWSYGHRNPQSAAIHPVTGKLWIIEHGARGGDEINIPRAGKNYGWPVITYGIDYSGARIGVGTKKEGMEQPIYYWDPSIAPSGMAFYTGDLFPHWKDNLFVGALVQEHLARLVLEGESVVGEERLLTDLRERIRDVRQGPEGALYLLTDSPEARVLRLVPATGR